MTDGHKQLSKTTYLKHESEMTYRPKHFTLAELVDPHFLTMPEDEVWAMLDENALRAIDALRDKFGPLLINGRGYTESGLRRSNTKTGAKFSMHK